MSRDRPDKLEADLSAYLDGELDAEQTRAVEQLLRESPAARRTLEGLRDVAERLAELPRSRAPDELTAAMTRQAERRMLFGEMQPLRGRRVLRLVFQMSASAAVIAACALVGWHVLSSPEPLVGRSPAVVEEAQDKSTPLAAVRRRGQSDFAAKSAPPTAPPAAERAAPSLVTASEAEMPADEYAAVTSESEAVQAELGVPAEAAESSPAVVALPGVDLPDEPMVRVAITPADELEYAATLAVLNEWSGRGLETRAASGVAGGEFARAAALEVSYGIPASDLQYRIMQLEHSAPEQVHVQVSVPASRVELLAQVGQPSANVPAPVVDRGGVATAQADEPEPGLAERQRRGVVPAGRGGRGLTEKAASRVRGDRRASEQPRAARPTRPVPERVWATIKDPNATTSRPARLGEETLQLLNLVLEGLRGVSPAVFGTDSAATTQPAERIAFSVILSPPPPRAGLPTMAPPATHPAAQPATAPASRSDAEQ